MKVLVGLDDSPYSDAAARLAIDLASKIPGTELIGLHVVCVVTASGNLLRDLPGRLGFEPAVAAPDVVAEHVAHGQRVLDRFAAAAAAAGVEATIRLDHGGVRDRLVHHAEQADLLILGDHGETEVRFPGQGGGHIGALLEACTVALMLVPRESRPLRTVVFGYDGSVAAKHTLRAVRSLFPAVVHTVHLVYVGEQGSEILDEAADDLRGGEVVRHVVMGKSVRDALTGVAAEHGADLLALGFRGKGSLRAFLFGSSHELLLAEDDLTLLVVH